MTRFDAEEIAKSTRFGKEYDQWGVIAMNRRLKRVPSPTEHLRACFNHRAGSRGLKQLYADWDRIIDSYGKCTWTGTDGVAHDLTPQTVHNVLRKARADGVVVSELEATCVYGEVFHVIAQLPATATWGDVHKQMHVDL